jgi:hypothetical protein
MRGAESHFVPRLKLISGPHYFRSLHRQTLNTVSLAYVIEITYIAPEILIQLINTTA